MIEIVLDLETTVNGGLDKDSPEAHYPNNRVLLWGYSRVGAGNNVHVDDTGVRLKAELATASGAGRQLTIIGHNLKFDLKHMIKKWPDLPWHEYDYYCTMYGEYRLSGHRDKFMSLEDSCANRNISFVKGLDLTALLASGLKMEDIPRSDLEPYLIEDVMATSRLYARQRQADKYLLANHTLPLAHMELVGLPLDLPYTQAYMAQLVKDETDAAEYLWHICKDRLQWDDGTGIKREDIKINASRTISYLLTGEPKAGLVKGKKAIKFQQGWTHMLQPKTIQEVWGKIQPTHLGYPVPEDKLSLLSLRALDYPDRVLKYRSIQKMMGTYIGPFLEKAALQSTIHPKMNMCQTNTGRLSSSQPNGQNMPPKARHCFESMFREFHEIDFKQLEIVALAMITQCPALIADLKAGEDIHFNTGKDVYNWKVESDMNDEDRRDVKAVNFGLIFGGGVNGLAKSTGLPKDLVKKLIGKFYARYPGVEQWQKDFYTEVTDNLKPAGIEEGEQVYDSLVELELSKRLFYFKESKSPIWLRKKTGRKYSFKPTETKNYPVQGFAGGDIVMVALRYLYDGLTSELNTVIRMTVHDSILVDTDMNTQQLAFYMKEVCFEIEQLYNMPFKLRFDIKSGTHWQ